MKRITRPAMALALFILTAHSAHAGTAPASLQSFWEGFKSAVSQKNKEAVSPLTQFPLSMPYGVKSVKTPSDFKARYGEIFNGEADAAKCFSKAKLKKTDPKNYFIACGFKDDPKGNGGEPIEYHFRETKSGWKFVGLDNINE